MEFENKSSQSNKTLICCTNKTMIKLPVVSTEFFGYLPSKAAIWKAEEEWRG
jgi:hypothetical protein